MRVDKPFFISIIMFQRISLLFSLVLFYQFTSAQVTTVPTLPIENLQVTITFDATQGDAGMKDYSGDVYVHTGVITNKSTSSGI